MNSTVHAQIGTQIGGDGTISSGVAGGTTASGLSGGGAGLGSGAAGNNAGQGIGGSNAVQGLTGSRDTVLQNTGFLNQADGGAAAAGGFLGGAQAAGQGAFGQGAAGGRNQFGNAGGFGAGGRGGAGFGGNRQPQQQRSTRVIRTRLTIAPDFVYPTIAEPRIRTKLDSQFQRVSQLRSRSQTGNVASLGLRNAQISTSVNDRTVTLRGQVASERDRVVAERMAKMEPGVDSVVNELVVVQ